MGDIEMGLSKDLETVKQYNDASHRSDPHFLIRSKEKIGLCFKTKSAEIFCALRITAHFLVVCYILSAIYHWHNENKPGLNWCNGLGLLLIFASIFYWRLLFYKVLKPSLSTKVESYEVFAFCSSKYVKTFFTIMPAVCFIIFILYDTYPAPKRLIPLLGVFTFILGGYMFSKYPNRIRWSIVYRGIGTQIFVALFTVRWSTGRHILHCIGEKVEKFISYAYVGAEFVYGDELVNKRAVFAFQCMSALFFIGFVAEILFYYQLLQKFFIACGWLIETLIGTTTIESMNSCISVFLGFTETPMLLRPYLKDLTLSELQAVMLGSLSTVAGTLFAAYVSFGVNPSYLLTASIMSAPAALSYSKLLYPETEESRTKSENIKVEINSEYNSVLSAASRGAVNCIPIVQGAIANIISCIAFVTFVNSTLSWLALLVGVHNFTLDVIISKLLIPVTLLMGVEPVECSDVAKLIAVKITINEFVAYEKLGEYKKLKKLSARSEFIATYALCSFANPTSVGVLIAILDSVCPEQKHNVTKLVFRAFLGGTVTCFITASISALLMAEEHIVTTAPWNSTRI